MANFPDSININGIPVAVIDYTGLLEQIRISLESDEKLHVTYATAHTINLLRNNSEGRNYFSNFNIIHPDGIGIYLAGKLLNKKGFPAKITGSDFYPLLSDYCVKNNVSVYFFGDKIETLERIKSNMPGLKVAGFLPGYDYIETDVVENINSAQPDIVIVGLGQPNQEKFIAEYSNKINNKVFICAGDGIKVFAGTKVRGPKFASKLGLEWIFRLINNPVKMFGRYIIGNPVFIYQLIKQKIKSK